MNLHFTIVLLSLENICPNADAGKLESQMKQSGGAKGDQLEYFSCNQSPTKALQTGEVTMAG